MMYGTCQVSFLPVAVAKSFGPTTRYHHGTIVHTLNFLMISLFCYSIYLSIYLCDTSIYSQSSYPLRVSSQGAGILIFCLGRTDCLMGP